MRKTGQEDRAQCWRGWSRRKVSPAVFRTVQQQFCYKPELEAMLPKKKGGVYRPQALSSPTSPCLLKSTVAVVAGGLVVVLPTTKERRSGSQRRRRGGMPAGGSVCVNQWAVRQLEEADYYGSSPGSSREQGLEKQCGTANTFCWSGRARTGGKAVWFARVVAEAKKGGRGQTQHTAAATTTGAAQRQGRCSVREVRLDEGPSSAQQQQPVVFSGRQATRQDGEPMEHESRPCEATLLNKPVEPVVAGWRAVIARTCRREPGDAPAAVKWSGVPWG